MKKHVSFLVLLTFVPLLSACVSFDTKAMHKMKKVALLSVVTSKELDTTRQSGLSAAVLAAQLNRSKTFNLSKFSQRIKNAMFKKVQKSFQFKFENEKNILYSKDYAEIPEKIDNDFVTPKNYKQVYYYTNRKDIHKFLANKPNYDGAMGVEATYYLENGDTFLPTVRVYLRFLFWLTDRNGKLLGYAHFMNYSKETPQAQKVTEKDVMKLCEEVTDDALKNVMDWSTETATELALKK